jgi:dipeptidyl aminopeptidase/acylaminoacyl peptidase
MTGWEQRLVAPTLSFPQWAAAAPRRLFFTSSEDGVLQGWVLDLDTAGRSRLTDQGVGVEALVVLPDGSGAAWWSDDSGDERGGWVATDAVSGGTRALFDGVPDGWSQGLALAPDIAATAVSVDGSYTVWVQRRDDPEARCILDVPYPVGLGREWETTPGGLSSDGTVMCLRHAEHGDILHFGLRALDLTTGSVLGELRDPGLTLKVAAWSPVPGDQRLAFVHERDGVERAGVWDVAPDSRDDLALDLPGPVDVLGWWPDGGSLLLSHHWRGLDTLLRLDLASRTAPWRHDVEGRLHAAGVRPDGDVWLLASSPEHGPRVVDTTGAVVLTPRGRSAPPGRPHRNLTVDTPLGPAHLTWCAPQGEPPFPTVMLVHGGPEWHDADEMDPWEQVLVDHGYGVARVNYRGSTGSTVAWRTALHEGNIGFPEVADVVAAAQLLVQHGLADPDRLAIEGASWGGYITLLAIGLHPGVFAAAVGVVPVADTLLTHEDCSPPQRDYDLAIMGGSPDELRSRYVERSPITYVDAVATPLLVIAGEYDSACPIRQVRAYVDRLAARDADVELLVYDAGHHANTVEDQLVHARRKLSFLAAHLQGAART